MKRRVLGVMLAGCVLAACDDEPTDVVSELPTAISSRASYTAEGITFRITNPDDGDVVFLDRCSGQLQRRTKESWKPTVHSFCNQDPEQDRLTVRLAPGAQLTDTTFVRVVLEPGSYRAVFFVSTDTTAVRRQPVFSNTFAVFPTDG